MAYKTTSLADQVFERLENDILFGVYPRGTVLTELRLVEELGVSRTPIREALRRLEQEHLIENSAKGSVVLGVTREDLLDILDIRLNVGGLAAYYAAQNATDQEIEDMRHVLDLQEFYYNKGDIDHIRQMDDQFHEMVCRFSRHTVISDVLMPLHRKTMRYRRAAIDQHKSTREVLNEHRAIFDALAAHDAELAQMRTVEHIRNARARMLERIKQNG